MDEATANLGNKFCTLCDEDGITNPAVTWCSDCNTFLCSDCNRHHGRNKASKMHNTISVEDYKELPTFITNTSMQCSEHKHRLEAYCSFHQVACCIECIIQYHNECKELRQLSLVLKDFKTSSSINHIENDLQNLLENFDKVNEYLLNRLVEIDTQKATCVERIQAVRKSINDHLDKLEKELLDDMDTKYIMLKTNIVNLLQEIRKKKSETYCLEIDFNKLKTFGTDLQTFEGIKHIERIGNGHAKYLSEIEGKDLVDKINVYVEFLPKILNVESIGNVKIVSVPVSLKLNCYHDKQAFVS